MIVKTDGGDSSVFVFGFKLFVLLSSFQFLVLI